MAEKKFSKKKADKVADYIDIISQLIVEYFDRKYKITKKVEEVKKTVYKTLFGLKKEFIKTIVEGLFLATGLIALVVGLIMILSEIVPLEYLFVGYGFLVTIFVLLKMKVNI